MKTKRLLADLDEKLVKKFKKVLIDNDANYRDWLANMISQYLKKRGGAKRKNEILTNS
ncbi:MAG: hypothetical protein ACUZ8E_11790 [Candidatus Anammoxibacter sp.]